MLEFPHQLYIQEEARGLRSGDATRPRDLVILDFFATGKHLIIDGVVTTVYRNSFLSQVSIVPGFVFLSNPALHYYSLLLMFTSLDLYESTFM
jgi:uncharacterized protein YacL